MTTQLQQTTPVISQSFVGVVMSIAMSIALLAWAYSIARKAITGEEVEYPLGG